MLLLCKIAVISGIFAVNAQVEGTKITDNSTSYYVDFSKDLKAKELTAQESSDGKVLVEKNKCVILGK